MMWSDSRIWATLNRASAMVQQIHFELNSFSEKFKWLLDNTSKTDSDEKTNPYQSANTSMSHEAMGLWTALGALSLGAPLWLATLIGFIPWGIVWESIQYKRLPTVRTLRDTLLGDNPSYLIGALSVSLVWYYGFIVWLLMTPILIITPAIIGSVFGTIPPK